MEQNKNGEISTIPDPTDPSELLKVAQGAPFYFIQVWGLGFSDSAERPILLHSDVLLAAHTYTYYTKLATSNGRSN